MDHGNDAGFGYHSKEDAVNVGLAREARSVSSTRYVIFRAESVEDFACWARPALRDVVQALSNPLSGVSVSRDVEEPLIGRGILNHQFRFAVNGKNHGAAGGLQALHHIGRLPAKICQRLNVVGSAHTPGIALLNVGFGATVGGGEECRQEWWHRRHSRLESPLHICNVVSCVGT